MTKPPEFPSATYRIQFNPDFGFADARKIIDYLEGLGVSHVYASPLLQPMPGSTHGYDVVDYQSINTELGGRDGFNAFSDELETRKIGLILDIVPNHMGISGNANKWWLDVLENGPSSPYEKYFDIDWNPPVSEMSGRILLPVLGDQFGKVLEEKNIQVEYDCGGFRVRVYERSLPLSPRSWLIILRGALRSLKRDFTSDDLLRVEFESIITAIRNLPERTDLDPEKIRERFREKEVIRRRLKTLVESDDRISHAVNSSVEEINGTRGKPRTFDRLEQLLVEQSYRLSFWRVATDEINYRRFFDINDLAALRVEEPEVFGEVHSLILQLVAEGRVDGLRVDHPDGLFDPDQYFGQLRASVQNALQRSGKPRSSFIFVEKILGPRESLRAEWPVDGTTGYDALNLINGLFVDMSNADSMKKTYADYAGEIPSYSDEIYECKKLILDVALASELHVLARALDRISTQHRYSRDFTFFGLLDALRELIACFPVYRTYIQAWRGEITDEDRRYIQTALQAAVRRNPAISRSVYDFIGSVLFLEDPDGLTDDQVSERRRFVMKFQQLTGPVMAKGVEDTAFYRTYPLASINEVGSHPELFGTSLEQFHFRMEERREKWPTSINAGSTHDTKRSEDVRARINVLSEIPEEWESSFLRWRELNQDCRSLIDEEETPDSNVEYLIYQTLLGTWPFDELGDEAYEFYVERIVGYMSKAMKEAKRRTSWVSPNEAYEAAVTAFIQKILRRSRESAFLLEFTEFQRGLSSAGIWNSLSQTLLRMTIPGIPDIYQGMESWCFSLVDPDNRRPVDFERLRRELDGIKRSEPSGDLLSELIKNRQDGRIKLYLVWKILSLRREESELFERGTYVPAETMGEHRDKIISFARTKERDGILVAAGRYFTRLGDAETVPTGERSWGDSAIAAPAGFTDTEYEEILSGRTVMMSQNRGQLQFKAADLFENLPLAVLRARGGL